MINNFFRTIRRYWELHVTGNTPATPVLVSEAFVVVSKIIKLLLLILFIHYFFFLIFKEILCSVRQELRDSTHLPPHLLVLFILLSQEWVDQSSLTTPSLFRCSVIVAYYVVQLVEQLESSEGAPPAEQDKIDSLKTVSITQEMIDKGLGLILSGCGNGCG